MSEETLHQSNQVNQNHTTFSQQSEVKKHELVDTLTARPKKLRRGIVINPDNLDESFFQKPLATSTEATVNGAGEKVVSDGNEYGTYMTDNENMVWMTNYSARSIYAAVPLHNTGYGIKDFVYLPSCGIVYEVDTDGIEIKKPKITRELQGVYNNGFVGDEWITSEGIPTSHFKVKGLTLKSHPNDANKLEIHIDPNNYERSLKDAIKKIKDTYASYQNMAEKLRVYLEGLSDGGRMNEFKIRQRKKENGILL